MASKPTVLCVCAHSDDQIFGPGGTLAKYARSGKKVITIILSYGEMSHPHFKEEVVIKTRVAEAKAADKIIGGSGVIFLGLKEGKFKEETSRRKIRSKLVKVLELYKPERILTHANDDPHPDHRATYSIIKEVYDASKLTCPVYTFDVWTPFSTKKRDAPRMIVDVSNTYKKKLAAVRCFKSQLGILQMLNWYVFSRMLIRNIITGWRHKHKFAEVFYRLR